MKPTQIELAGAINQVAKRLMDIGWIDRAAIVEGNMKFGYTELGKEKMSMLHKLINQEIDSALTHHQYIALQSMLLTRHDNTLEPD